jgi:hypothetical protein
MLIVQASKLEVGRPVHGSSEYGATYTHISATWMQHQSLPMDGNPVLALISSVVPAVCMHGSMVQIPRSLKQAQKHRQNNGHMDLVQLSNLD